MCDHDSIFDQLAGLLGAQAEQTERMAAAVTEAAQLTRAPANVRTVASDRVRFLSMYVRDDRPIELIGEAIDRARVTIMPVTTLIYLGDEYVSNTAAVQYNRATLAAGVGLTLDTRGAIHAIAPAGFPVTVTLCIEQWDAVHEAGR